MFRCVAACTVWTDADICLSVNAKHVTVILEHAHTSARMHLSNTLARAHTDTEDSSLRFVSSTHCNTFLTECCIFASRFFFFFLLLLLHWLETEWFVDAFMKNPRVPMGACPIPLTFMLECLYVLEV